MTLPQTDDGNRVAVYIRWSTDEQSDGTTLAVQLEGCRLFVQSQGWQFREELLFVDDGYSGGTLVRPGLARLRQAVAQGEVSCVVVYKLDRLSRSVLDTVTLVLREWEGICAVRSAREPVDTANPTGSILFYMLASYAEWERSTIRERTLSGKIKRAQQGRNPGFTPPYGYGRGEKPGDWVVNESEAAVVRRIFREYALGLGVRTIAQRLTADGICPRRSTCWRAEWLARLLRNPIYAGELRYGLSTGATMAQQRLGSTARIHFAAPRYADVPGAVPRIVSQAEFAGAQRVRATRIATPGCRARRADFLLTGIARCRCGAPLRGDRQYYRCSRTASDTAGACRAGLIPANLLEAAVLAKVQKALLPSARRVAAETWAQERRARAAALASELQRIHRDLTDVGRAKCRMLHDYGTGELPARLFANAMAERDRAEERLRAACTRITAELKLAESAGTDDPGTGPLEQKALTRIDPGFGPRLDPWVELGPEERKQVLRYAVSQCVAYRAPGPATKAPLELTLAIRTPASPN